MGDDTGSTQTRSMNKLMNNEIISREKIKLFSLWTRDFWCPIQFEQLFTSEYQKKVTKHKERHSLTQKSHTHSIRIVNRTTNQMSKYQVGT